MQDLSKIVKKNQYKASQKSYVHIDFTSEEISYLSDMSIFVLTVPKRIQVLLLKLFLFHYISKSL